MMATQACLACGHQNKRGAAFCAACSTSLNLKLCAACEAVNALAAEECHACGASLGEGQPVKEAPVPVAVAERLFAQAPRIRLLPLDRPATAPARTGRFASLWIVSVALAAGGGYYIASRVMPLPVAAEPTPPASEKLAEPTPPTPVAKSASAEPAKPVVMQTAPAPKRAPAQVTHTHAASTAGAIAATAASAATVAEPVAPILEKAVDNQPVKCAPAVAALGLCPPI